jgi:hypothetical protein
MVRPRRKTFRRGRTRPGRLALIDHFLEDGSISIDDGAPLVVDVGFGDEPLTTLELKSALGRKHPDIKSIGVEADEGRAERARDLHPGEQFVHGGFDLVALGIADATLVRCFNVLRGYGLDRTKSAQLQMLAALKPGGLLIEGSTDPGGALACAHLWRKTDDGQSYEGLICATDFSRGFAPLMFRDVFPRDLRRHGTSGEPAFDWLARWASMARDARKERAAEPPEETSEEDVAQVNATVFELSAARLANSDPQTDARLASRGALIFRPTSPSHRPEVLAARRKAH